MMTYTVASIARQIADLDRRIRRVQYDGCRADYDDEVIEWLMLRGQMAGLCIAMRQACEEALWELKAPDKWTDKRLIAYVARIKEKP